MSYPYYSISWQMKGEQKEVEKARKRLAFLFKTEKKYDEEDEYYYWEGVNEDGNEEEISDESEQDLLYLWDELNSQHFHFEIEKDGVFWLNTSGSDGYDSEEPWKRLYEAISYAFHGIEFFFSSVISGEYGDGAAWHIYKDTEEEYAQCQDSGERNYESGGIFVAHIISDKFHQPEMEARKRVWLAEGSKDVVKAKKEYDKLKEATDRMESLGNILYDVWQEGDREALNFSAGYNIGNDFLAELLEAVEKGTFSDGSNVEEVPQELKDIKAIIMKAYCDEITKLPEAIQRCTNLKEVNLTGSGVKKAPDWLAKMKGVKVIV